MYETMKHMSSSVFKQGFHDPIRLTELNDSRLTFVQLAVKSHYENADDPGHDWSHVIRVWRNCLNICKLVGADQGILSPSALLHDYINVPKDSPKRLEASRASAEASAAILRNAEYDEMSVQRIQRIIVEHSYSLGCPPTSIESAVLQDADRLDAIGAIGIFRAASCGCRLGAAYYNLNDPFVKSRTLDEGKYTVDHFFTKLLELGKQMNTAPAKAVAERRIEFMYNFLSKLQLEIGEESEEFTLN
jgi:uncharacterized protein